MFRHGEGGYDTFTCRIICSKTRFCFFSDWSRNNTCGLWFTVFWLAVIFQRDYRPEASQKTEWFRRSEFLRGRVFFMLKPPRISIIILWRQNVVQVNMFWPLSSLTGFLENHKGVGMFQNCLQNKNGDISWVALDLVLDIILSLL